MGGIVRGGMATVTTSGGQRATGLPVAPPDLTALMLARVRAYEQQRVVNPGMTQASTFRTTPVRPGPMQDMVSNQRQPGTQNTGLAGLWSPAEAARRGMRRQMMGPIGGGG